LKISDIECSATCRWLQRKLYGNRFKWLYIVEDNFQQGAFKLIAIL